MLGVCPEIEVPRDQLAAVADPDRLRVGRVAASRGPPRMLTFLVSRAIADSAGLLMLAY